MSAASFFASADRESQEPPLGASVYGGDSAVCPKSLQEFVGEIPRRHISPEELSIHISAIAAKADQARACGDRHGSHLYALQMVDAVKDHYKAAAREQRWLDEGPDYFSVQGALAHEGLGG